jgi:hypothetical protein
VGIPKIRTAALAIRHKPHGGVGVAAGAVGDGAASVSALLPAHWSEQRWLVPITATAMDTALATATRVMPIAIPLMVMATRATRIRTPIAAMPLAPMPMPDPTYPTGPW